MVGQVGICSPVQSRDLTKQAGWLGLLSLLTALSPLPPNILLALLLNLLLLILSQIWEYWWYNINESILYEKSTIASQI